MKLKRHRLRAPPEKGALGRFVVGNSGGPGRPPKQLEQEYLLVTYSTCTLKHWRSIIKKAVSQARAGDAAARSWLSKQLGLEQMKLLVDLPDELQPKEQVRMMLSALSDSDLARLKSILEKTETRKGGAPNGSNAADTIH